MRRRRAHPNPPVRDLLGEAREAGPIPGPPTVRYSPPPRRPWWRRLADRLLGKGP